jgi:hypothetical protein
MAVRIGIIAKCITGNSFITQTHTHTHTDREKYKNSLAAMAVLDKLVIPVDP